MYFIFFLLFLSCFYTYFFSPICDYVVEIFFHANDSGLKYPKKTLYLDNKILVGKIIDCDSAAAFRLI